MSDVSNDRDSGCTGATRHRPTGDGDVVIPPSGFGASVYAFSFDFTNEPDPNVAEERGGFP